MACCQMLVQVRLLCEARVASHERGVWTPEGPLSRVCAKMVQEIVQRDLVKYFNNMSSLENTFLQVLMSHLKSCFCREVLGLRYLKILKEREDGSMWDTPDWSVFWRETISPSAKGSERSSDPPLRWFARKTL